jgi:NADH-quinone oxidoreductase subunit F
MLHILERIRQGVATPDDVELLDSVAQGVQGKCLCALGEFASGAVMAGVERFRTDFDLKVASQ